MKTPEDFAEEIIMYHHDMSEVPIAMGDIVNKMADVIRQAQQEAQPQWQPIETAVEGEEYLAVTKGLLDTFSAEWINGVHEVTDGTYAPPSQPSIIIFKDGEFIDECGNTYDANGFHSDYGYTDEEKEDAERYDWLKITYIMPLPLSPKKEAK